MSELYDTDILTWSERQAALLRRIAEGERVNDQVDWRNVADEVESVGRNELHRTQGHLIQAMRHRLKIMAWPDSAEVPHWQEEVNAEEIDAALAYQASMHDRLVLDFARLYRKALRRFPKQIDGRPPAPLPGECPFTLDELLGEGP